MRLGSHRRFAVDEHAPPPPPFRHDLSAAGARVPHPGRPRSPCTGRARGRTPWLRPNLVLREGLPGYRLEHQAPGQAAETALGGALGHQPARLVSEVRHEARTIRIGVADRGVAVRQAFEGVDMVAQGCRGGQYLPQNLYLAVGSEELLALLCIEKSSVDELFEMLVRTLIDAAGCPRICHFEFAPPLFWRSSWSSPRSRWSRLACEIFHRKPWRVRSKSSITAVTSEESNLSAFFNYRSTPSPCHPTRGTHRWCPFRQRPPSHEQTENPVTSAL